MPSAEENRWLTIPNGITLLRALSIVPFVILVTGGRDWAALILFVIAGLTDTLDGTIARRLGQSSRIGRLLDPIVDKLFTGVAYVALSAFRNGFSHIPIVVMLAVLLRDLVILCGSAFVYFRSRNSGFTPSVWGKLNTFLEISVVVCFLAVSRIPWARNLFPGLYPVLILSIVVSAADYFRIGARMLRHAPG